MDRIGRLEGKIDEVQKSVHNIDVTMAKNTESLIAHMKRTSLLEKLIFMSLIGLATLALAVLTR